MLGRSEIFFHSHRDGIPWGHREKLEPNQDFGGLDLNRIGHQNNKSEGLTPINKFSDCEMRILFEPR